MFGENVSDNYTFAAVLGREREREKQRKVFLPPSIYIHGASFRSIFMYTYICTHAYTGGFGFVCTQKIDISGIHKIRF